MSARNVIDFLLTHAARADVLESLRTRSKDEVIAAAADFGCPFTEEEFDPLIWGLEMHLAERRGESFDPQFPLWQTMWGKHYLDYLVNDLMPSLGEADLRSVLDQV